jgi:predicted outer membrane repeat protein
MIRHLASTWMLLALIASAQGANQVVTDKGDTGGTCPGATCTLRQAIAAAQGSGGGTITFNIGTATIVLTSGAGPILPTITSDITIDGGNVVTISGNNATPAFQITSGATLTLKNLTITKCLNSSSDGGAVRNGSSAGNGGTLNITNCKFLQNAAAVGSSGGAIVSYGPLNITNSEFANNQAGNGGAVYPRFAPAVTTITGCNFHDNSTLNTTNGWGGAMLLWDGAQVTVTNSQFTNNMANSGSFTSSTIDRGGAIYVTFNSKLTVDHCEFAGNSAFFGGALYVDAGGSLTVTGGSELHDNSIGVFDGTQGGGAIYNLGTLMIDNAQIHDNQAQGNGGGIDNVNPGSMQVHNSAFRHNHADLGGAIENVGNAVIDTTTLADNIADNFGGAIDSPDETDTSLSLTVSASTLSGNSAGLHGGAIESEMKLTLTNVTISGNSGAEILDHYSRQITLTNLTIAQNTGTGLSLNNNAMLTMHNTLLASNSTGNCSSAVTSGGFNLADDTSCGLANTGDHQGAAFNPQLGPLTNNGGPTQTQLPGTRSPAIDAGTGSGAPATDQRGTIRPQGAAVDIGAVEVAAADLPTLANISTRLAVQTGDNALIGGFIVTGTQPKKVIIEAIGPSLPFQGVLADPTLELYQGDTLLESNDNWVDSPNKQAIIDSMIAPSNNLESAIVRTLPANNTGYTAIVRGTNNGTGIGVVQAYDLDLAVDSKLANISTRGFVQTGDNVLFAGTIILGRAPQKVIIRAIGPSLAVTGALADPTLQLVDANGAVLEENDNWVDSPNKQAIIDTTIPPSNNKESAIVRTLFANGAQYTAIVRGVNNATGIAVLEVYALN